MLDASLKLKKFTELSGVVQLQAATCKDDIDTHWAAIEDFIGTHVMFEADVKGKLAKATENLEAFDASMGGDISDLLDNYCDLFDICTSWFGSEFENNFKKIQRFLHKCPSSVQKEYAEFVSPKYDGMRIDELSMGWGDFDSLIRNAWGSASVKKSILSGFGLDDNQAGSGGKSKVQGMRIHNARPAPAADIANFANIDCDKCKKAFVPSSKQVEKFEQMQVPLPDRCPKCKGQICDAFKENGACPFGDGCKFLHPDEFKKAVGDVPVEAVKKHSYPCRFHAIGKCLSGDNCKFQHDNKAGSVYAIQEVEPGDNERKSLEDSIQDTYSRFPADMMIRPKRKVVVDFGSDND